MLAKAWLLFPLPIIVPVDFRVPEIKTEIFGYQMRIVGLEGRGSASIPANLGQPKSPAGDWLFADLLRVEVSRERFNHGTEPKKREPPVWVLLTTLNRFLIRYRRVVGAAHIRPVAKHEFQWQLDYCDDEGRLLEPDENGPTRVGSRSSGFIFHLMTPSIWEGLSDVAIFNDAPPWMELLLDAKSHLPSVGPAIVLGAVALEVFIISINDQLAKSQTMLSPMLWDWLNKRGGDRAKRVSVEENFDVVLKELCGHSLKENARLWAAMKQLKEGRNKFVHEGMASLKKGLPISAEEALELLESAEAVTHQVRDWLPEQMTWRNYVREETGVGITSVPTSPFFFTGNKC